jgi:signal transduction histidine kinase
MLQFGGFWAESTSVELRPPRSGVLGRLFDWLPRGDSLPDATWGTRHRVILAIVAAHVPVIFVFGVVRGFGVPHSLVEVLPIALPALVAVSSRFGRMMRASAATFGLVSSSAVLVHMSGGMIEMHFHFFVAVMVIAMYESWFTFGLAIAYVVIHHGVIGTLDPAGVYNHPAAVARPWLWAGIHGGFVALESVAAIVFWRFNETARLQLEANEAELRRMDGVKTAFIADAAHELRTPLTILTGMIDVLGTERERLSSEEVDRCFVALERQGVRAVQLVKNLLDLSRLEQSKGITSQPVDVGAHVRRAIASVPPAEGTSVEVRVEEGMRAVADPDGLEQVLINLLTNAYKYGGHSVTVEGGRREDRVILTVSDDGPGIEDDLLPRLFEPFTRGERSASVEGSGLGMTIVRRLMESVGGAVDYEPMLPRGSRFVLTLPGAMEPSSVPTR